CLSGQGQEAPIQHLMYPTTARPENHARAKSTTRNPRSSTRRPDSVASLITSQAIEGLAVGRKLADPNHEPLAPTRDHGRETVVRTGAATNLARQCDRVGLTAEVGGCARLNRRTDVRGHWPRPPRHSTGFHSDPVPLSLCAHREAR